MFYDTMYDRSKEAFLAKTSSIRAAISLELRLVTKTGSCRASIARAGDVASVF